MKKLAEINMGSSVYTTPWAEDGTLYIATRTKLFAIRDGARTAPAGKQAPTPAPSGERR
jgi:hypothetical protein